MSHAQVVLTDQVPENVTVTSQPQDLTMGAWQGRETGWLFTMSVHMPNVLVVAVGPLQCTLLTYILMALLVNPAIHDLSKSYCLADNM